MYDFFFSFNFLVTWSTNYLSPVFTNLTFFLGLGLVDLDGAVITGIFLFSSSFSESLLISSRVSASSTRFDYIFFFGGLDFRSSDRAYF